MCDMQALLIPGDRTQFSVSHILCMLDKWGRGLLPGNCVTSDKPPDFSDFSLWVEDKPSSPTFEELWLPTPQGPNGAVSHDTCLPPLARDTDQPIREPHPSCADVGVDPYKYQWISRIDPTASR